MLKDLRHIHTEPLKKTFSACAFTLFIQALSRNTARTYKSNVNRALPKCPRSSRSEKQERRDARDLRILRMEASAHGRDRSEFAKPPQEANKSKIGAYLFKAAASIGSPAAQPSCDSTTAAISNRSAGTGHGGWIGARQCPRSARLPFELNMLRTQLRRTWFVTRTRECSARLLLPVSCETKAASAQWVQCP